MIHSLKVNEILGSCILILPSKIIAQVPAGDIKQTYSHENQPFSLKNDATGRQALSFVRIWGTKTKNTTPSLWGSLTEGKLKMGPYVCSDLTGREKFHKFNERAWGFYFVKTCNKKSLKFRKWTFFWVYNWFRSYVGKDDFGCERRSGLIPKVITKFLQTSKKYLVDNELTFAFNHRYL